MTKKEKYSCLLSWLVTFECDPFAYFEYRISIYNALSYTLRNGVYIVSEVEPYIMEKL